MEQNGEFRTAFRRAGQLSAALAGIAALSWATVGFAADAGAATGASTLKAGHLVTNGAATGLANSSSDFAGYTSSPSGGLASGSLTFKVPTINCAASPAGSVAYLGASTNTESSYALVELSCSSGNPVYNFVFATPAGGFTEPGPAPGDMIHVSVSQSSFTYAQIHDMTNGAFWFADDNTNVGDATIDFGAIVGTPVVDFAKTRMMDVQVNGDYLTFESPVQWNAVSTHALVTSSALTTTANGTSFGLNWKHST